MEEKTSGGSAIDGDDKRDEEFARKARDRLSGALSSAIDRVEGSELLDGIPDLTASLDSPLKRLMNSTSPWNSPTKSPRSSRRRRRKEPTRETVFHHTFVLKLFDRSVDLAQFESNSPLYPVCRAWMKDQPHKRNFVPRARTPTPEPQPSDEEDGTSNGLSGNHVENDGGDEPIENGVKAKPKKKEKHVYKMPTYEPLSSKLDRAPRIPESLKRPEKRSFNMSEVHLKDASASQLLREHMSHWTKVRKSWRDAYAQNETRYGESMDLLKKMFENTCQ